ncbi:thioredoxin domain-containing protein [Hanstruepera marina]|uniref:thioredoxin domain-containing protein n=1 Tax=Hanstruepera marina TaxID=2873265 RepID=UPI001CA6F956|nr:thioredoxin domain-containing protein [Hanstruepera marina]
MKRIALTLAILFCSQITFSQTINQTVINDKGNPKLLGKIDKSDLQQAPFNEWFEPNYNDYLVNKKVVSKLKDSLHQYYIKVFLGSWCGDSKKEVPRFYHILDMAKFPKNQLEVIAVDRTPEAYKQAPNHEEQGLNIHRVPTFIFYKNGQEVNRIVEHPMETLERDILNIVSNKTYRPNYVAANYVGALLETKSIDSLQLEHDILVPRLAEFVKGSRELNTLGYVYLRTQEYDKALYIFNLNTQIFPYKYNVYDSLGEAYFETKNYDNALKNYYKVLSLKPDDDNAKEMIEKIKSQVE